MLEERHPLVVIPARYGSSRFPGKPLEHVAGKPLIAQTLLAAQRTGLCVIVATDDERIAAVVESYGGDALMTGDCRNGTERCAEVARILKHKGPVINWQGDSPLVPAGWIRPLMRALRDGADIATPVQRCTPKQFEALRSAYFMGTPGGTFAVLDAHFRALYFSKAPIPHRGPWWMHIGIYAYTARALEIFGREEAILEKSEQLEQLRFLESGFAIQAIPVDGDPIWEVNNPDDVHRVEELMRGAVRA